MSTNVQQQPSLIITFAHYLEAEVFLGQSEVTAITHWNWGKVFQHQVYPQCWILITGEGPWKAFAQTTKLMAEISALQGNTFTGEVFNLGIAGALRPAEHLVQQLVSVRTVYARIMGQIQFHSSTSFSNSNNDGDVHHSQKLNLMPFDCITAQERILSLAARDELAPFASIIDRELWGIAQACQMIGPKIPWNAIKLISDQALENSCELVMSKHRDLSEQLATVAHEYLSHFINHDQGLKQSSPLNTIDLFIERIKIEGRLHFTFHQRQEFQQRLKQLLLLYSVDTPEKLFHQINFQQWQEQLPEHLSPKIRTKKLILWLERMLYPDLPEVIFSKAIATRDARHD